MLKPSTANKRVEPDAQNQRAAHAKRTLLDETILTVT
jgi:hypothetical protein